MKRIALAAVGPAPDEMEFLRAEVGRRFRASCAVLPVVLDPSFAYETRRGQYHSTAILQRMQKLADGARLLGVTEFDLYVPVLTFVFGEAQLEGDCALVSACRLREEFYGMPVNPALFRERLVKEAVHELGHTFGLLHCGDWSCVMSSSHAVERIDVKGADFCRKCAVRVNGGRSPGVFGWVRPEPAAAGR